MTHTPPPPPSWWQKTVRYKVTIPAAIIVCYQALPYITDRPSLHCTSVAVPLNPRGNPPLPIQITLHRAQGSDVASDRERTNPGPQPHRPAQRRPRPAVFLLWKNIFECLVHSLTIQPPHMLLSFRWGFYGRGYWWLWQVVLKGCTQRFIGFHFWTEGSGVFW